MEDTLQGSNEPKKINLEDLNVPGAQNSDTVIKAPEQTVAPVTLDVPAPTAPTVTADTQKLEAMEAESRVEENPEKLIADLQATSPMQSTSKFKKILMPLMAGLLVLVAGAGAGAYFFIFKGNTEEEIHAAPVTDIVQPANELEDVSKDLEEKLTPEDEVSDTAVIVEPDSTADTSDTTVTDDTADTTPDTTDTTVQPVKRIKRTN